MTLPQAEAIFLALADVDPAAQAAFIDARCGNDASRIRGIRQALGVRDV